jgi:hypothetical protein
MQPPAHIDANRREFLRSALRYATLSGLAGIGAAAALNGQICRRENSCTACWKFSGCDQSQAEAARQAAQPHPSTR